METDHFCQPRMELRLETPRRNPLITAIFWAFWPQLLLLPPGCKPGLLREFQGCGDLTIWGLPKMAVPLLIIHF